nr:hypothetical protein [Mycobacterium sp. E3298]
MRVSSKQLKIKSLQEVETTITAEHEEITAILEDKTVRKVSVMILYTRGDGSEIETKTYDIVGGNYGLLMSESPDFAPGKPLNEYREDDLWYIIGLMDTQ